jgi:AraC-like DNA-binding protein
MRSDLHLLNDFHLRGAGEAGWNQRYVQLSPGVMRSTLAMRVAPGAQVFYKWMSERVAQQGGLPADRLCFSLLAAPGGGTPRMQGQTLEDHSLFILRGGEAFDIQRPQGMALLSVTFAREAFLAALDGLPRQAPARRALGQMALRLPPAALQRLRRALRQVLEQPADGHHQPMHHALAASLMAAVLAALQQSEPQATHASGRRAAALVRACQHMATGSDGTAPQVDELCRRMATSRRTLQNSFRLATGTTPLHYLRSVRLNAVRSRLLATAPAQVSVSQAASDQGFGHLSHFSQDYKALFGELPSQTARA